MFDKTLTWIDGFGSAIKLLPAQQNAWWTPETAVGLASLAAAALSAVAAIAASHAALTANKASALQAKSNRRLEILRITSENLAELLTSRDRFIFEMKQAKADIGVRHPDKSHPMFYEIDRLTADVTANLQTMIEANDAVTATVFRADRGAIDDWDDHIRSVLLKRKQIVHIKAGIDLKISDVRQRALSLL